MVDLILGSLFVITLGAMLIAVTSLALCLPVILFSVTRQMWRDSR